MANDSIVFAGLTPHAPVLIPGVGGTRLEEVKGTVDSMSDLSQRAVASRPDVVVLISPHSPRHQGAFGVWRTKTLSGSFERFDCREEQVALPLDLDMVVAIEGEAKRLHLRTWSILDGQLDHGATVPLWYLEQAGWKGPTVVLSLAHPGGEGLSALGEAIASASILLGRRTVIIASGDMSHRLRPGAPCGYAPTARVFDEAFVGLIDRGAYERLGSIDAQLQESAAEDVMESTLVATAAAGGRNDGHEVLSYEGPFGVGYCVAVLFDEGCRPDDPSRIAAGKDLVQRLEQLPRLARHAIAARLRGDRNLPQLRARGESAEPGCVFVTLYDSSGALRGCIGTLKPTEQNLLLETWRNAQSAAFSDPRFPALTRDELAGVRICVTVLGEMEPVASEAQLDAASFGVVVRSHDGRRGVLLPDIEGVDTPASQIAIARRKAGISADEPVELFRFRVRCFEENSGSET